MTHEDFNEVAAHCPTCGAEYRSGFDICADDGTRLVFGPPPPEPVEAPTGEVPHGRWTRVSTFARDEEARLLAGRLNADGIPARIYPEEMSSYYGTATGALLAQGIDVLVPEERVLEARELIERIAGDD